jgi:hypothetical protein
MKHGTYSDLCTYNGVNLSKIRQLKIPNTCQFSSSLLEIIGFLWRSCGPYSRNGQISQTAIAEKLNIGLANVNDIIAGFGHKKVCALWLPHTLTPDVKTTRLKAYEWSLDIEVKVMIICTAVSTVTRDGCITISQKGQISQLHIATPLLPTIKKINTQP